MRVKVLSSSRIQIYFKMSLCKLVIETYRCCTQRTRAAAAKLASMKTTSFAKMQSVHQGSVAKRQTTARKLTFAPTMHQLAPLDLSTGRVLTRLRFAELKIFTFLPMMAQRQPSDQRETISKISLTIQCVDIVLSSLHLQESLTRLDST